MVILVQVQAVHDGLCKAYSIDHMTTPSKYPQVEMPILVEIYEVSVVCTGYALIGSSFQVDMKLRTLFSGPLSRLPLVSLPKFYYVYIYAKHAISGAPRKNE